jgi:hypothetical protein
MGVIAYFKKLLVHEPPPDQEKIVHRIVSIKKLYYKHQNYV